MNLFHLHSRLARLLTAMPTRSQLPAGYVDPITAHLRAQIAAGVPTTPTTPEGIESAKASLAAWFEKAGRASRARAWS